MFWIELDGIKMIIEHDVLEKMQQNWTDLHWLWNRVKQQYLIEHNNVRE